MHKDLENKVAIITGASRGLGQEYAVKLAEAGAKVIAADITDCNKTTQIIKDSGGTCMSVQLDVRNQSSCDAMAKMTFDKFGRIDILVNNAALYGSLKGGRFDALAEQDWNDCLDVNISGIWRCCKAVIGSMKAQQSGSIINISSLAALAGLPYALHYSTSKAAVIGLTKSVAVDYVKQGIRCNAICPGTVDTPSLHSRLKDTGDYEKAKQDFISRQPLGRIGKAEEIASLALYLSSDESSFVTGQTHVIDGGWSVG